MGKYLYTIVWIQYIVLSINAFQTPGYSILLRTRVYSYELLELLMFNYDVEDISKNMPKGLRTCFVQGKLGQACRKDTELQLRIWVCVEGPINHQQLLSSMVLGKVLLFDKMHKIRDTQQLLSICRICCLGRA